MRAETPKLGHQAYAFPNRLGEQQELSLNFRSDGFVEVATCWRPTDAELRRLQEGEAVYVVFFAASGESVITHDVVVGAETLRNGAPVGEPVAVVDHREFPLEPTT